MLKNECLAESKWNLNSYFKPKLKLKMFLLNWVPEVEEAEALNTTLPFLATVTPNIGRSPSVTLD